MSDYTPEQIAEARKIVASEAAKKRWANMTDKQRAAHRKSASDGGKKRAGKLSERRRKQIARKAGKASGAARAKPKAD